MACTASQARAFQTAIFVQPITQNIPKYIWLHICNSVKQSCGCDQNSSLHSFPLLMQLWRWLVGDHTHCMNLNNVIKSSFTLCSHSTAGLAEWIKAFRHWPTLLLFTQCALSFPCSRPPEVYIWSIWVTFTFVFPSLTQKLWWTWWKMVWTSGASGRLRTSAIPL